MSIAVAAVAAVLAAIAFWFKAMAARERANDAAQAFCRQRDIQFLDGTVAFARLRLARAAPGWTLRRIYSFEFSPDGVTRTQGFVIMDGTRVVAVDLPPGTLH